MRAFLVAALLLTVGPSLGIASTRYDPRLRFRTLSTLRFDIHYHQNEGAEARRLAAIAEAVAATLDGTLGRPSGRVQVILVDQNDLSNGWATPLPFNTIEITAAAPGGNSTIGNSDDWLTLVFTHEYTHIVHLSRGAGLFGGLRRAFGRMPLLYPNVFLPIWQIEGLAVYEESASTGQGRLYAADFHAMLDVASVARRLEPLDRANGGLIDWPSGQAAYVYGAHFHRFLAERYGEESLQQLTDATAKRVPYLGAPAFKKIFHRSLGDLWREFEESSRHDDARTDGSLKRLTFDGFDVVGPRFDGQGVLFYSTVNPHGFPSLRALDPASGTSRRLADRFLGSSIGFAGSTLVIDQLDVVNQVGMQWDLYAVSRDGGRPRRLTAGARAADPDVSPDGRTVVSTIQQADRRELALVRLSADLRRVESVDTLLSEPGVNFASPRWSPDGRLIAVERGPREIVLVDPAARRIVRSVAASARGRTVSPAWTAQGDLVFASDRDGTFRIYKTAVERVVSDVVWRLEGTGLEARCPDASPDGRLLVFVGTTPSGHDLFSLPLTSARWTRVDEETAAADPAPSPKPVTNAPATAPGSRTYSPLRTIAPRFWTPTLEDDQDEIVIGAATAGTDALGRHTYAVEGGWATSRARPDYQLLYAYDRWWPTIFASFSDDTDPWRDGEVRSIEANAGVLLPFRRVRWTQALLGSFHASTDQFRCSSCGADNHDDLVRRAVRGGWMLNASRQYGYSISTEEGWSAMVSTEITREALGAEGDSGAALADVRAYVPVWPRHGVVAARLAGATTWGEPRMRRIYSAAGSGPQPLQFEFGSDAIGLLRGVDESDEQNFHAAVANLDYRFPLLRVQRGAGTLPVFLRTMHGALFADAGNAWRESFRWQDVRASTGGELSMDVVLGYVLPVTFTAGASWVFDGDGGHAAAFARIGRAF